MTNRRTDQLPESSVVLDDFVDERDAASFSIVGVGASAGGLEAFTQLLGALPCDTGMAFVLVQHLAPTHASALAEILSRTTHMPVTEVQDKSTVEPNHVYVIPPAQSMIIAGGALHLLPRDDAGMHRPIDQFFSALAEERRHLAIGVILSGTGADGTLGLEAIKAEGGITFAQDATAHHEGMPQSAIASGSVDFVLPPDGIAREIVRIGHHADASVAGRVASDVGEHSGGDTLGINRSSLTVVLQLLHDATGVDFTFYKFDTLYRRITRRMVLQKLDDLSQYEQLLRQTPGEVEMLYRDILISVTGFFRDPESFEAVKRKVFPRLLKWRTHRDPVRIWVLGCSTGEEAYSLAMAYKEAADAADSQTPLQVFATDLNSANIVRARAGVYSKDIARNVSPERLRRFFTEVDSGYRISKTIRDACIFSRHDVLADPAYSRLDLVSCRNLLIYMEPVLQRRIVSILHYALKPAGCLWLGNAETIGSYRNLFEAEDVKHRIFSRKPGSSPDRGPFALQHRGARRAPFVPLPVRSVDAAADLQKQADRILLTKFASPGVVVSADLEILQFRGDTGPYLTPAPGKASFSLLKMLRGGLLAGVRGAILRAGRDESPVRDDGLRVEFNGSCQAVAIEVIPLRKSGENDGGFLVLFEGRSVASGMTSDEGHSERRETRDEQETAASLATRHAPAGTGVVQELAATRDYLKSLIEEQDATTEALQAANEEVQSANEELQTINEELETSKEEIQSSNEELITVNDELNNRNAELNRANSDLVNLIESVQSAIVILGPDLRIRRFTPSAEKLLNLIPTDVGRSLAEIKLNLDDLSDLESLLRDVFETVSTRELDVRDRHGHWYSLRLRPYQTLDKRIDGIVVTLVDVDAMKRANEYTESIVATVREPLLVLNRDLRVQTASRSFYDVFQVASAGTINRRLYELGNGQWDIPELRRLLEEFLPRDNHVTDFEMEHEFEQIGRKTMRLNARRLIQAADQAPLILVAIEDVTRQRQTQMKLEVSELRFRRLFEASHDGILILDATDRKIIHVNQFLMKLLDYSAEHFCGKELWEVGFLGDKQASQSAMQQLDEEGLLRYENLPLQDRHGHTHPVEMVATVYQEGGHNVIQCIIRDISDRSRLEQQLRNQAEEVADLHRRKDEFLAMLSHELRSPLAPLANAVQLLGLQQASENQLQQQARGIIERQLGHLQRLVDDLLEVSRITTGKVQLHCEPVDMHRIVEGAVETVRPLIEQRRHQLTVLLPIEPIRIYGDPARLEQVVANLLTNAAKYTEVGGHVWLTVSVECREKDGAWRVMSDQQQQPGCDTFTTPVCATPIVVIRVRDTGVGIAPALLPHIFDLFTQAERSLDRSQGGLGIGLALVQRLTELHGGTVEACSSLGQGSEFVVRLPIGKDAGGTTKDESDRDPSGSSVIHHAASLKVLVVDDNVDTVLGFSMLLRASGHNVRTAHDGLTAVDAAIDWRPDVVLLDIGLPGLTGYEVAKRIRQHRELQDVVLVALTGYGQDSDRQASLAAGFNHHLVKPARFKQLQEILATVPERELREERNQ